MSEADRRSHLVEIATTLRRAIEPGLKCDAEGRPISAGACLHASVMLAGWVSKFGGGRGRVRGGDGDLGQGARTSDGLRFVGHYWCEASFDDGAVYFIDITADQLGHPEVVVALESELDGRYIAGRQDVVDEAAIELAEELGCRDLLAHQLQ